MGLVTTMYYGLLVLLLFVFESLPQESLGVRLPDIYWNATNPIFRIDNTDHIIDVNRDNLPYDQVNIICPVYAPGTSEEDAEKYIIYNVSKEEYDTCRITNPNPRIIAVCDKPYKLMYFTITFRSFTPQPGGLEFRPGQDYYFISTSSRDDLHRRVGGRCLSHNMKVVFKVCCHPEDSPAKGGTSTSATLAPALPPRLQTSSAATVQTTTTTMATTFYQKRPLPVYTAPTSRGSPGLARTTNFPPLHQPLPTRYPPKKPPHSTPSSKPTRKKELDKLSNEVVKNEELTSLGVRWNGWIFSLPIAFLTMRISGSL